MTKKMFKDLQGLGIEKHGKEVQSYLSSVSSSYNNILNIKPYINTSLFIETSIRNLISQKNLTVDDSFYAMKNAKSFKTFITIFNKVDKPDFTKEKLTDSEKEDLKRCMKILKNVTNDINKLLGWVDYSHYLIN